MIGNSSLIWPMQSMRNSLLSLNHNATPEKFVHVHDSFGDQINTRREAPGNEKAEGTTHWPRTNLSIQTNSVGGNRFQFAFHDVTHEDLISGVFDNLFRENEEFLSAFDICRDDIQNQVQSILFQHDRLQKLFSKIDELCKLDFKAFLERQLRLGRSKQF